MKIIGLSGSLRAESKNTALLRAMSRLLPESVEYEEVSLELPMYRHDEGTNGFPDVVTELGEKIREADALIITTPEYNWSMTTAMKNFVDWMSIPSKTAPINNHVVALAGVGGGKLGSVRAQLAIRTSLLHNRVWVIPGPEVLVSPSDGMFDDDGDLTDEFAVNLVQQLLDELIRVAPQLRQKN